MSLLHHDVRREAFAVASHFRDDFFGSLTVRGDTLFELTDALLCAVKPSARRAQGGASVIHSPMAASDFAPVRTAAATAQTRAVKG